jgi:hypothetical protein
LDYRHPEVLALLGEPRRMATGTVLAAVLRDARKGALLRMTTVGVVATMGTF